MALVSAALAFAAVAAVAACIPFVSTLESGPLLDLLNDESEALPLNQSFVIFFRDDGRNF